MALGFSPKQIVPAVMIRQGDAGLVGALLHREFENVECKFKGNTGGHYRGTDGRNPMFATIYQR